MEKKMQKTRLDLAIWVQYTAYMATIINCPPGKTACLQ